MFFLLIYIFCKFTRFNLRVHFKYASYSSDCRLHFGNPLFSFPCTLHFLRRCTLWQLLAIPTPIIMFCHFAHFPHIRICNNTFSIYHFCPCPTESTRISTMFIWGCCCMSMCWNMPLRRYILRYRRCYLYRRCTWCNGYSLPCCSRNFCRRRWSRTTV